jgi:hypothetical protein
VNFSFQIPRYSELLVSLKGGKVGRDASTLLILMDLMAKSKLKLLELESLCGLDLFEVVDPLQKIYTLSST